MDKSLFIMLFVLFLLPFSSVNCSELSSEDQLRQSWETYKQEFIQADGRVIDYYANGITTSEGQSYAMLRAVWLNDQPTFDKVLNWTNSNLKVRQDNLFGWKWGKNDSGQWTIIEKASASDADQDIALALILGYEKWKNTSYLDQAMAILNDLWNKEVFQINGVAYMASGDWALYDENVKLNPSYFAPYAYRIFARYDRAHDWIKLVDSSYNIIEQSSNFSVFHLTPDWVFINKKTGELTLPTGTMAKESDFSYDAIRTLWRLSLDYVLNNDQRALSYLKKSTNYLIKYWQINSELPTAVTIDGVIRKPHESYAIYGPALPAIALVNSQTANQIYYKKIASEFDKGCWANPKDYYSQNLIWFGIALWNNIDSKSRPLSQKGLVNLLN